MNDWVKELNIKGPPGDASTVPGPPNVLTVGTVETVLPTEPADVKITGTSPAQEINFKIPQGPPGPGAAGINQGTGAEIFAGADPGTGIMEFWRVRGTGLTTAVVDANGVKIDTVVGWTDISGKPSTFPPTLPIAESDVTGLVADLAAKAPLASPTFTGDPRAPTPATSDNDTSVATTAFVKSAISAAGAVATVASAAPGSPLTGQIWWNTTNETLNIWDGTAWKPVLAAWA